MRRDRQCCVPVSVLCAEGISHHPSVIIANQHRLSSLTSRPLHLCLPVSPSPHLLIPPYPSLRVPFPPLLPSNPLVKFDVPEREAHYGLASRLCEADHRCRLCGIVDDSSRSPHHTAVQGFKDEDGHHSGQCYHTRTTGRLEAG